MDQGMERACWFAESSHDPDMQTGCAIFKDGVMLMGASNRVPTSITVTSERTTRPEKYNWIEHCERAAIYKYYGSLQDFEGATMYLNWFPCVDCARAIVAVRIARLVYVAKEERMSDPRYGFEASMKILREGNVQMVSYKKEMQ